MTTTEIAAYDLPARAAFLTDAERRDPLAPLRGVLLGILLGGALWLDVWFLLSFFY